MPGPSLASPPILLAQAPQVAEPAAAKGPATDPLGGGIASFLPLFMILIVFWLLLIRPQQRQERKRREMIDALKRNDRVLTTGGLFGTVVGIDADAGRVTLRVDDDKGIKVEVARHAVAQVLTPDGDAPKEKPAAAAK